eukprot:evm.model.scf_1944.2 EVM.evm.TU.scf_1944.2   scf_1944:10345-15102(+)
MLPAFAYSQFLSADLNSDVQRRVERLPPFPPALRHCLITGPERSGKTSVLFHYAHSIAATGNKVVFICKRKSIENCPPLLPQGISKDDPSMCNIHMRYLDSPQELQKFCACLHLLDALPCAVVVDNISSYLDNGRNSDKKDRDRELVKNLAYLHEAVNHIQESLAPSGKGCFLVVSDVGTSDGPRALYLYQRWLPLIFVIDGGPSGFAFSVSAGSVDSLNLVAHRGVQLQFSSLQGVLALENIEQNGG